MEAPRRSRARPIIGGEPDPALFDEEFYKRFKEASPSEARQLLCARLNPTQSQCPACYDGAAEPAFTK